MSIAPASKVKTAPVPASTGTTLSLDADTFDRFPADPPFDALVWEDGEIPDLGVNAEEVVVSIVDEDDWTIMRGTPAAAIKVGWNIAQLAERTAYDRDETVSLSYTFASAAPPYSIHTRAPDGVAGSSAASGAGVTASYSFDPDKSGIWFYRFSGLGVVGPERDFYVRQSSVL